jgi:uroporphyrinogen-III synthase
MKSELARLVAKHGGEPRCVPAVVERPELSAEVVSRLIDELGERRHHAVIFMTGVAVSLLFELAERIGRRSELVEGLRGLTTACRGPKPAAALRGFSVPPSLTAGAPYTGAEMLDTLGGVDLSGKRIVLFHYGERSETLAETLLARHAELEELWLYRWQLPDDTGELENLVVDLVAGRIDALAVTCQIQFRHLYQIAERIALRGDLVRTLNEAVVVGAVGPTTSAIMEAHGVRAAVRPEHPKMGPLVITLMRHLAERGALAGAAPYPPFTH